MKFFRNKKGFTLVELMIVLILLGFGAFALINLSQAAWRSFHKSEERYTKQETVKYVAEYLQKNASIGAATCVELYNTLDVLPANGETDTYNYIFVDPATGYLYIRPAGKTENNQLSDVKLYIDFAVIPFSETKVDDDGVEVEVTDETRGRGIVCNISAMENEFQYKKVNGKYLPPDSDDIYYNLKVAYHFANMYENGKLYVNYHEDNVNGHLAYVAAKTNNQEVVADNAVVIKYISDISLTGENLLNDVSMNAYCFVATASYGQDSGTVGLLCDFRDSVLMQSAPGRAFVKAYYTVSPPIAKVIAGSEPLKAAVRLALKPLVIVATFALDHDLLAANTAYIVILMISAAAAVTVIVYCKKRRKE